MQNSVKLWMVNHYQTHPKNLTGAPVRKLLRNGSHLVGLTVKNTNRKLFREALGKATIDLPVPGDDGFLVKINPSLNRMTPQQLAGRFLEVLKS